ncbi:bifunctional diguanylate cyclase/phosphodiesterase [Komagataeibacter diospyri]|uniref:putative bifunctional diguanylate cyclase/phosphodiesterase n=1 Tax=Komagataeibacter diospyri TaxID=1932662 RepID=UPI00113D46D4|nr:EAL domain-containing protein [Komagataeibacter diospyri]GCE90521.1 bacterial signalling protein GGDEF/EAL domain-containing protein [Komagataeibacter diospyri]
MSNHIYELRVYNPFLLSGALIVCVLGAWITMRLVARVSETSGRQRVGWYFLTAMAGASFVWCTHFAAMLAYHAGADVNLDPQYTVLSLVAMFVAMPCAVMVAVRLRGRGGCMLGGIILGLGIASMHYIGMAAYHIDAPVVWNMPLAIVSVLIGIGLSAAALLLALRPVSLRREIEMTLAMVGAVAGLHFTGMAAMHVTMHPHMQMLHDNEQFQAIGFAVIAGSMLTIIAGIACFVIDGSVRQESYDELHRMAMSDALTGLPNRISFNERLNQEVATADQNGEQFAVIGIDLNKFKEINDTRGHAAGDVVLTTLAGRFSALLGEGEFVARLGGDEFIAIHRTSDQAELHDFVNRIQQALNQPIPIDDYMVTSGGSIGVAVYPVDATDSETLISRADLAMYRAKTDLQHTIWYYESSLDQNVRERRAMGDDLRDAMTNGQLSLFFQVQTVVATGAVSGYEALLRWEHPVRGSVPPTEILDLAYENGLIIELGEWVLDQACQAAVGWDGDVRVAVNMSASQFLLPRFADTVQATLARTGLPAGRLVIEITEATIQRDRPRALAMARKVHALGVRLALDEFGGPKSVLSMLREFPFDKIKIDRTLMQQVGTDPAMAELVRSVMIAGHALQVSVLAQGIETPAQLALLSSEGCDEGQGYLLGRPAHAPMAATVPAPAAPTMPQAFAATPMRAACAPSFYPAA